MRKYKHIQNQARYTEEKLWDLVDLAQKRSTVWHIVSHQIPVEVSMKKKKQSVSRSPMDARWMDHLNFSLLETKEPHCFSLHTYFFLEPFVSLEIAVVTCSTAYQNGPKWFINGEAIEASIYPGITGISGLLILN